MQSHAGILLASCNRHAHYGHVMCALLSCSQVACIKVSHALKRINYSQQLFPQRLQLASIARSSCPPACRWPALARGIPRVWHGRSHALGSTATITAQRSIRRSVFWCLTFVVRYLWLCCLLSRGQGFLPSGLSAMNKALLPPSPSKVITDVACLHFNGAVC